MLVVNKRQRKPRSANYRDAWGLILQKAKQKQACESPLISAENIVIESVY